MKIIILKAVLISVLIRYNERERERVSNGNVRINTDLKGYNQASGQRELDKNVSVWERHVYSLEENC